MAESLIRNYKGIIKFSLIKHEQNGGLSVARNTGIKDSNGEYIYFLDSDDEITENCISSLIALVEKYPGVDIVQGNVCQYPKEENDRYELKGKLPEFISGNKKIKKIHSMHLPVNAWNKLISNKFITNNNLFFKPGIIHEDFHWLFFMIKSVKSFAFTDEYCYIRYILPDSIMRNPNLLPSISSYLTIAEDMLSNLDIDLLGEQLWRIRGLLKRQNGRIQSDEKYLSLLPRCQMLQAKSLKNCLFVSLILTDIKWTVYMIIKKILGKKLIKKIKGKLKF